MPKNGDGVRVVDEVEYFCALAAVEDHDGLETVGGGALRGHHQADGVDVTCGWEYHDQE